MRFWLGLKLMRLSKRLERLASWISPEWANTIYAHNEMTRYGLSLGIKAYNQSKTIDPTVAEANRIIQEEK